MTDAAPMTDLRVAWVDRQAVTVTGPDATSYLQGQLSQDIVAIPDGASAWSWVLQPAGKVDALVRVTRLDGHEWMLDVDGDFGALLVARLTRFKLRTKADIDQQDWRCLRVLDRRRPGVRIEHTVLADATWGDGPATDVWGPAVAVPDGALEVAADELERLRIRAGIPKMGAELTERTIPAETGLIDGTVSFTKGCYTGQELVARIDSRGSHVPRRLRGVHSTAPLAPGDELRVEGKGVGAVTSAVPVPDGWIGLAYVGRAVEPPADVIGPAGHAVAVVELPPGP